ncbi:MAG: hypothetical protein WCF16_10105 [Alphaproteobacteria bacterium]
MPSSTSVSRPPASRASARTVALALALLALGLFAADRAGGVLLDRLYPASGASPAVRIAQARPQVLVLGSSIAKYAIDPAAFLPGTFNAAANGQGLFYAAALVRNLPQDSGVKRIVFGVDPAEFIAGYKDSTFPHLADLGPLARHDPWLRDMIGRGDPWAELKFQSRLYYYRGALAQILKRLLRRAEARAGFEPLRGVAHGPDMPVYHDVPPGKPSAHESLAALDLLLEAAAARGIQVVGLAIPEWGRDFATAPRYQAVIAAIRARLEAAGACDVIVAESVELDRIRNDGALSFDGAHMNAAGAAAYSPEIARLIRERCGG